MKPYEDDYDDERVEPAAFGRLCVETVVELPNALPCEPAAFGRLCVETIDANPTPFVEGPAAFGRLCVETKLLSG